jgi:hypothetical protein
MKQWGVGLAPHKRAEPIPGFVPRTDETVGGEGDGRIASVADRRSILVHPVRYDVYTNYYAQN